MKAVGPTAVDGGVGDDRGPVGGPAVATLSAVIGMAAEAEMSSSDTQRLANITNVFPGVVCRTMTGIGHPEPAIVEQRQ